MTPASQSPAPRLLSAGQDPTSLPGRAAPPVAADLTRPGRRDAAAPGGALPTSRHPRGDAAPRTPAGTGSERSHRGRTAAPAGQSSLTPGLQAIANAMAEDRGRDSLEARMRRLIKDLGLWAFHPRRSEKSERGWPDWTIVGTRIIYRELKTERGKVTAEQQAVGERLAKAGGDWAVWRPRDLLSGRIAAELRAITQGPLGTAQARTGGAA